MDRFNFFAKDAASQLLKIRLPADMPHVQLLEQPFDRFLNRYELVAMETVQAGTLLELVYSIELRRGADVQAFLAVLASLNDNNKVVLVTGQQEVDL
jgi:hypothetical protein